MKPYVLFFNAANKWNEKDTVGMGKDADWRSVPVRERWIVGVLEGEYYTATTIDDGVRVRSVHADHAEALTAFAALIERDDKDVPA